MDKEYYDIPKREVQYEDISDPLNPEFDYVEGNEDVNKVAIPKRPKIRHVFKAIKRTLAGETLAGEIGAVVKNYALKLVPFGKPIDVVTDAIGQTLTQDKRPMFKKIASIKNFINVRDEDGNFSLEELVASVVQIILAGAIVYGLDYLGIFDKVVELLG